MSWKEHFELGKQSSYHIYKIFTALVAGVAVARSLGPESMGYLALIYAVGLLLTPCLTVGCGLNLLREINVSTDKNAYLWAQVANRLTSKIGLIFILLITGLLSLNNLFVGLESHHQTWLNSPEPWLIHNNDYYTIALVSLLLYTIAIFIEHKGTSTLLIKTDLKKKLSRDALGATLGASLKIASCALPTPGLVIIGIFSSLVAEAFYLRISNKMLTRELRIQNLKESSRANLEHTMGKERDRAHRLVKEGIHILPTTLISELTESIKKFSLANCGTTEIGKGLVGQYSIAQRQAVLLNITGQSLYERYKGAAPIKLAVKYSLIAGLVTALTLPLIPIIYGADFQQAVWAGAFLLIPNTLAIIAQAVIAILVSYCATKPASFIRVSTLCITALLSLLLAPKLGVIGISIAATLGETTCIIWGLAVKEKYKRTLNQAS